MTSKILSAQTTDQTGEGLAKAAEDLLLIFLAVSGAWSLRFLGVPYVGPITMAVGIVTVFALLKMRGQHHAVIGLGPLPPRNELLKNAGRLLPWFGGAYLVGGLIGVALFGQPEASSAITEQSENFWWFLLDVTLVVWVLIAFGEELVFRGFTLNRLLVFTGTDKVGRFMAAGLQALWFGAGHASQGGAGMVATGVIGFTFAWFYLRKPERTLWPLILVHGTAATIILSIARYI